MTSNTFRDMSAAEIASADAALLNRRIASAQTAYRKHEENAGNVTDNAAIATYVAGMRLGLLSFVPRAYAEQAAPAAPRQSDGAAWVAKFDAKSKSLATAWFTYGVLIVDRGADVESAEWKAFRGSNGAQASGVVFNGETMTVKKAVDNGASWQQVQDMLAEKAEGAEAEKATRAAHHNEPSEPSEPEAPKSPAEIATEAVTALMAIVSNLSDKEWTDIVLSAVSSEDKRRQQIRAHAKHTARKAPARKSA